MVKSIRLEGDYLNTYVEYGLENLIGCGYFSGKTIKVSQLLWPNSMFSIQGYQACELFRSKIYLSIVLPKF